MFESRSDNGKAIDRAFRACEALDRGGVIEHGRLADAFKEAHGTRRYYKLVDKLKTRMERERGISLFPMLLTGYVLATAKEQLELARFRITQAARRKRKGLGHVVALPSGECTFVELRCKQTMEDALMAAERRDRQDAQRMAFLLRPREQRPRIAPPDPEDGPATQARA